MAKKKEQPQSDLTAQVQAIIAQLGQAPAPQRKPLGVPAGYTAQGPLGRPPELANFMGPVAVPTQVQPRYFEGDDLTPAGQPTESIVALQNSLIKAGLLKSKYRYGVWDEPSQTAYRQALEFANASGVTDQQAIATYANAPQAGTDTTRAPLVKRTPNPDDLRATFTSAARSTLGHGVDDATIQQMVTQFQKASLAQQQREYDISGTEGTGGTTTEIPDAATFGETQLRRRFPTEAAYNGALHGANLVMQAFTGGQ